MIAKPGEKFISKSKDVILQYIVEGDKHYNKCLWVNSKRKEMNWRAGDVEDYGKIFAPLFCDDEFDMYYDFKDYLNQIEQSII